MYALMYLQYPLLSECLTTEVAAILALLLKVSECTLQNNTKKHENPSREKCELETTVQ
jgi:hypothetical protein